MAFQPMPLSRRPLPFDHPEWIFELKYDGFRSLTAEIETIGEAAAEFHAAELRDAADMERQGEHKYERNKTLPQWHGWHAFRRGLATNLHRLGWMI